VLKKTLSKNKNYTLISIIFIILLCFFFNSLLLSRNFFGNHSLLIFTEASQFLNGKSLYKEIYVKYGILGVLINASSLYLFGDNIFSIHLIINSFYFLSLFLIGLICFKIHFNKIETFFILLIIINIHPAPIPDIPWPNYLAFLPIVSSLFLLLEKKKNNFFFSGALLSLSCLIRETIFLSAIIIILYLIFHSVKKKSNPKLINFYIIGFSIPFLIFLIYMFLSRNYLIWLELILPTYKIETLTYLAYYYEENISLLRKFYIFFLVPYRELLLTFFKALYYFWPDWILIFVSWLLCLIVILKSTLSKRQDSKNKNNNIHIISIYALALIFQNLHSVTIFRVATGSILGIITFAYFVNLINKNKKIKYLIYAIIILIFFNRSYETFPYSWNLKKFYLSSFVNINKNLNNFLSSKTDNPEYPKIVEFKNMNYDQSIHKFYFDLTKVCNQLRKDGIKYSYNQTSNWEFSYFCKTQPKNYYPWIYSSYEGIQSAIANFDNIYDNTKYFKKFSANKNNTIEFHFSNTINIKDFINLNSNGDFKGFRILYSVDLNKNKINFLSPKKYFLIIQNN
jgi:hypothetical protein